MPRPSIQKNEEILKQDFKERGILNAYIGYINTFSTYSYYDYNYLETTFKVKFEAFWAHLSEGLLKHIADSVLSF